MSRKKHGGGPKTEEGKQRSSMNALRHGFAAKTIVLSTEDPAEFKSIIDRYVQDFDPQTEVEKDLVEELAACRWRLQRAWNIETEMYEITMSRKVKEVTAEFGDVMHQTRTGLGFMAIADEYKAFALLNRYETRIARRYHQVLNELKTLKTQRERKDCKTNSPAAAPQSTYTPQSTKLAIVPKPEAPPAAPPAVPEPAATPGTAPDSGSGTPKCPEKR